MFPSYDELASQRLKGTPLGRFIEHTTLVYKEEFLPHYPFFGIAEERISNGLKQTIYSSVGVQIQRAASACHLLKKEHRALIRELAIRDYWYFKLPDIEKHPQTWMTSKFIFPREYARAYYKLKLERKEKRKKFLKKLLGILIIISFLIAISF